VLRIGRGVCGRALAVTLAASLAIACTHGRPFVRGPAHEPPPRPDAIDHRILLIGDAGDPREDGEPGMEVLEQQVRLLPDRTTVVFLGDNVYETGMPPPSELEGTPVEEILDEALFTLFEGRRDAERRVKAQVKAVDVPGVRAIFVAGNHDWDQFGIGGWERVREFERYLVQLREVSAADIRVHPGGGCPGPDSLPVGRRAQLVLLDTQWWLERGAKPSREDNSTRCRQVTEDGVLEALKDELRAAKRSGRVAVVAAHHPLDTKGPHGGFVDPWAHVFPLTMAGKYVPFYVRWLPFPVLGSIGVWWRGSRSPSVQDMSNGVYKKMRRRLRDAMEDVAREDAAALVYAAGHDHSLQVFASREGPEYTVVSGLGSQSKASSVRHSSATLFAHSNREHPGLVKLDVLRDGRVRLGVVEWTATTPSGIEVYSRLLDREPEDRVVSRP
jgi:hypothetical protein